MNVRLITKALHTLSLLSEEDVTTVMNLRALSDDERSLLVMVLEPRKPRTKRAGKKSASKGASKSVRASGMAAAIKDNLSQRRQITLCGFVYPDGSHCNQLDDNPIHAEDGGYAGYHEFDAGKSSAPRVGAKSLTNGAASDDEQVSVASGD